MNDNCDFLGSLEVDTDSMWVLRHMDVFSIQSVDFLLSMTERNRVSQLQVRADWASRKI